MGALPSSTGHAALIAGQPDPVLFDQQCRRP